MEITMHMPKVEKENLNFKDKKKKTSTVLKATRARK